jgi:hypothetical protein
MNNSPEYWARINLDYSNKMKETYNTYFIGELKEKFDEFTNNIMMSEEVINSNNFYDTLEKFRIKNYRLVENENNRPHQPCVVM